MSLDFTDRPALYLTHLEGCWLLHFLWIIVRFGSGHGRKELRGECPCWGIAWNRGIWWFGGGKVQQFAFLLLALLLSSCEINQYEAHAQAGNWVKEINLALGGTGHSNRSDGSTHTYDNRESFKDATQAAVLIGGSLATASVNKAKEITSQQATKQAQQTARDQIKSNTIIKTGNQKATLVPDGSTVIYPPQQ